MKNMIVLAGVVLAMAGAAYVVAAKFVVPAMGPQTVSVDGHTAVAVKDAKSAKPEPPQVYMVEQILVNPKGTSGTRYLSTSVGIEVPSATLVERLRAQDLKVRDMLISVLSSKTVPQLNDPSEREAMRAEIQKRISQMLGNEPLSAVYFVDYVMQ